MLDFTSHFATQTKSQMTHKTYCLELFECVFSHAFTNTIQALISHEIIRIRSFYKGTFERETLAIHLRVRDCSPTIIYTISLKFSFTPTSPSTHPWEVLSPNTYLTHSEYWEKFWCIWEVLEEAIKWRMQFGANCGIWITSEDMARRSSSVVGT